MESLGLSIPSPTISKSPQSTTISSLLAKQSTLRSNITKRRTAIWSLASILLSSKTLFTEHPAIGGPLLPGIGFDMVAPEQSFEEAMSEIRVNAESLLAIKPLLETESWGDAQRAMRKASALLKRDMYTIIQNKPGEERPRLRKLYSDLFNGVTRLDYASRDMDRDRAWECYGRITKALDEIFSRL